MKRLTELTAHEREHLKSLNLVTLATEGFYQCIRCKHIGEPERLSVEPQEIAPPIVACVKCGCHVVKHHAPALPP